MLQIDSTYLLRLGQWSSAGLTVWMPGDIHWALAPTPSVSFPLSKQHFSGVFEPAWQDFPLWKDIEQLQQSAAAEPDLSLMCSADPGEKEGRIYSKICLFWVVLSKGGMTGLLKRIEGDMKCQNLRVTPWRSQHRSDIIIPFSAAKTPFVDILIIKYDTSFLPSYVLNAF